MNSAPSGFYISNRMGRILLQAAQETIGPDVLRTVPDFVRLALPSDSLPENNSVRAFPFEAISGLLNALEKVYGPKSGRGLALLIGRACFKYGMRLLSGPLGFDETSFRLLPPARKLQTATQAFVSLVHAESDVQVRVEEKDGKLFCHIERCPLCFKRTSESPACHLVVGLLQESVGWLGGGNMFNIKEIQCIARGEPACIFEIDLNPIS